MSIKKKLLASFSVMIVIALAACISIFYQLQSVDENYSNTMSVGLPQVYAISDMRNYITMEASQVQAYLLGDEESLQRLRNTQSSLKETLLSLEEQFQTDEAKQLLADSQQKIQVYEQHINATVALKQNDSIDAAAKYFTQSVAPTRDEAVAAGQALNELIKNLFDAAQQSADHKVKNQQLYLQLLY